MDTFCISIAVNYVRILSSCFSKKRHDRRETSFDPISDDHCFVLRQLFICDRGDQQDSAYNFQVRFI